MPAAPFEERLSGPVRSALLSSALKPLGIYRENYAVQLLDS